MINSDFVFAYLFIVWFIKLFYIFEINYSYIYMLKARNIGIVCLDIYFPNSYVNQEELGNPLNIFNF